MVAGEREWLRVMLQRIVSEHTSLKREHNVHSALYVWLLPAVSFSGAIANALWLLIWWLWLGRVGERTRYARNSRRERDLMATTESTTEMLPADMSRTTSSSFHVQSKSPKAISFQRAEGEARDMRKREGEGLLSVHSSAILLADLESVASQSQSQSTATGEEAGRDESETSPILKSVSAASANARITKNRTNGKRNAAGVEKNVEEDEGEGRERSACALQLELYALTSVAMLLLVAGESLCVERFHTHPSLMHSALCSLWPLLYQLLMTFPTAILIFPLVHKCKFF